MQNHKTQILIVDSQPVLRMGLRAALTGLPYFEIVGEAENVEQAWSLIQTHAPNLIITDLHLKGQNGLELLIRLQHIQSSLSIIIFTSDESEETVAAAFTYGALGYVLKDSSYEEVLEAVKTVAEGGMFTSPRLAGALFQGVRRATTLRKQIPGLEQLTPTEQRILRLIAQSRTNREIGKILFISPRTVETHRAHIAKKLNLRGPYSLLRFALEHRHQL